LGRLLEDIHVIWAHLEKKQTRLQLYTEVVSRIAHIAWKRRHNFLATPSDHRRDGVRKLMTALERIGYRQKDEKRCQNGQKPSTETERAEKSKVKVNKKVNPKKLNQENAT
ncbi:hypothetical protein Tco_1473124, partial [Tanacetum coccineum]